MNLPQKFYTEKEVTKAKASAKMVGWLQGAGVMLGGAILWNLLGWIPVLLGMGVVGWVIYKLFTRPKKEDTEMVE